MACGGAGSRDEPRVASWNAANPVQKGQDFLRFRGKVRLCAGLLVTADLDRAELGLHQLLDRLRNDMTGDQRRIEQHAAKRERSADAAA